MSSKKQPTKFKSHRKQQPKQTVNPIQAAGALILFLALAGIVYLVARQQTQARTSATATADAYAMRTAIAQAKPADATQPAAGNAKQWDAAPPMTIDKTKQYFATVKMAKGGEFTIQLYADKAPVAVNSFVFLARQGFFNGVTFHRVLEGFMAQGGDPTGTGTGGPGYQFQNENSDLTFDKPGVVAMANAGPDTNGSQFFITFAPAPHLNGGYTIFGQVTSGMDVVNALTRRDPQKDPSFPGDAMESVTIIEK